MYVFEGQQLKKLYNLLDEQLFSTVKHRSYPSAVLDAQQVTKLWMMRSTYTYMHTHIHTYTHRYIHIVFIRIKARLKYTQGLKYTPGSAAE